MLFIDVEKRCLVYGSINNKYMALSYVWGQVATMQTTVASLARMLTPGAIDLQMDTPGFPLPRTIRDFLRLVQLLGGRYAWVDALCIVHDAPDMDDQLNAMAAIYAGAYLTVISKGTDANFGLPGIGSGARPRSRASRPLHLPNLTVLLDDWSTAPSPLTAGIAEVGRSKRLCSAGEPCTFGTYISPSESLDWIERHPEYHIRDWGYLGLGMSASVGPTCGGGANLSKNTTPDD
ncbi:HET-domain-containing protein [Apiospora hydei]|uniref:HET-domain-containing protein n=1 Tax=Apiospora hydei TaxID=1337664 RepID=A0ABR1WB47_9PEZI